jgi:virulence-associated protein VagC
MKATVTENGVVIPKKLLKGVKEVEIQKEDDKISIIPILTKDTLLKLGTRPVRCGLTDASEKHDKYLYGVTS